MKMMTKPIDDYDPQWVAWNAMHPNEPRSVGAAAADGSEGEGGGSDGGDPPPADDPAPADDNPAPKDGDPAPKDGEGDPKDGDGDNDKKDGFPEGGYQDFTLPEGMELDKNALEAAMPFMEKKNMSQADAQELVDVYAGLVQKQNEASVEQWNELQTKWTEESTKGGLFEGEAQASIKAGFDTYEGGKEIQEVLGQYFLDKHPAVRKFMRAVGQSVQNDSDTPTPEGGADDNSEEARLRKRYPSMYPKES